MAWDVAAGRVVLGTPADRLGDPMSPVMAASKVDEWFPSYDSLLLPKLQEIVRAAGGMVLRNDGDELRELVKRALYEGKLVASLPRRIPSGAPICRAPDPPPKPILHDAPACETQSLRFRLVVMGTREPVVDAKVTIEHENGTREEYRTNQQGEIYFSSTQTKQFKLVCIDEPLAIDAVEQTRG